MATSIKIDDELKGRVLRLVAPRANLRELVIGFGDSGYIARYRFAPAADAVYVLAFRHQKETRY